MSDLEKLINDKSLPKDDLEKGFQISCKSIISTAEAIKRRGIISDDIAYKGKAYRWLWWLINKKRLNVTSSDILKGWAKSLNK